MADAPATAAAPAAAPVDPKAPKTPAVEAPKDLTPAEKKIWKLKANGKEIDFDASDEERVKQAIQKGLGADETFQTAAQMRKEAERFMNMLKDPITLKQVLNDPRIGIDLKKFAEEYVWEQIQEQQMTPEQKRQRQTDQELQKYKDQEGKDKAEKEAREAHELHQAYAADYDKRITAALSTANLPRTPATVQRMAHYMFQAVKNGYELEPADLVEQVRKDYIEDVKALFGQTDGDALMALLGEDVSKKLRESDMKRLKSTHGSEFATPTPKPAGGKNKEKPKKLDGKSWRDQLIKEALGRR